MAAGSLPAPDPAAGGLQGGHDGSGLRLAVVTARWNHHLTGRLLAGARRAYEACNIDPSTVLEAWAPGAFELPLVCQQIAASGDYDAVTVSYTHLTLPTTPYV